MTTTDAEDPQRAPHVHVFQRALFKRRYASCPGGPSKISVSRAAGDANPWAGADPNASWQRTAVTEDEWRTLRDALRHDAEQWRQVVTARTSWDDMGAAAALSTTAHTAYHVGAIRQILAAL